MFITDGPKDGTIRRGQAKAVKATADRKRATELLAALTPPKASDTVKLYQNMAIDSRAKAAKQRQMGMIAVGRKRQAECRKKAKEHEDEAKRLDRTAQDRRDRQLEDWRQVLTDTETMNLAELRATEAGMEIDLELTVTEVPDWRRDDNGALARDKDNMPILDIQKATARRRKNGLDLLLEQGNKAKAQGEIAGILQPSHDVGIWYGGLCEAVRRAGLSGREETGLPSVAPCKASTGPANWKLDAIGELARVNGYIREVLPRGDGDNMIALLVAVCQGNETVYNIAGGKAGMPADRARVETRIASGLAMLRVYIKIPRTRLATTGNQPDSSPVTTPT